MIRIGWSADQQLAVKHGLSGKAAGDIGKGGGYIITGPRKHTRRRCRIGTGIMGDHQLHTDTVPFPFGVIGGRVQPVKIAVCIHRIGQHHRVKGLAGIDLRFCAMSVKPGEQPGIGNFQPVPDLLDFIQFLTAVMRKGRFGKTRRHPDPQPAGGQLDHCPTFICRRVVQQMRDMGIKVRLRTCLDAGNEPCHPGQIRCGLAVCVLWPDQRNGFGHVTNVIIGHRKQIGIDSAGDKRSQPAGLQVVQRQITGDRGKRIAAVGIGRVAEIAGHSLDLGIARRGQDQRFQQFGKAFHSLLSSSRPCRYSGSASSPRCRHQWTSASSRPCVTQMVCAPVAAMVSVNSFQSA